MAVVNISGGVLSFTDSSNEANTLQVTYTGQYGLSDSANVITLGSEAKAQGWGGSGTNSVGGVNGTISSVQISPGGGTNTINVRQAAHPITLNGDTGQTTINLNSTSPALIGNLASITKTITVNAGINTTLNISDFSGNTRPGTIVISSSSITNLAPNTVNLSGTFSTLFVQGSNNAALAENYTVNNPPCKTFTLTNNNGPCTINIAATAATSTINAGTAATTGVTRQINLGTVAGASDGLDWLTKNITITAGGTPTAINSLRIDDSGSVLPSPRTVTIDVTTISGFGSSGTTITYPSASGALNGTWRIDGSNKGKVTFAINANLPSNLVIVGSPDKTNEIDLTAITGATDIRNPDGTGVVTLSNGKTITYSGMIPPAATGFPLFSLSGVGW